MGEQIEFPFLHAYLGGSSYYVYQVRHRYEENTATTDVLVRAGFYNQHVEYLKDQAEFDDPWFRLDHPELTESQLEDYLQEAYGRTR